MPISSEDFRDVLRHFPSGVTVVTIKPYGSDEVHGLTVSAFASISPEPPPSPDGPTTPPKGASASRAHRSKSDEKNVGGRQPVRVRHARGSSCFTALRSGDLR